MRPSPGPSPNPNPNPEPNPNPNPNPNPHPNPNPNPHQVDVTIGSALDIFGGALPYQAVVEWDAAQAEAALQPPAVCPFHMPAGVPGWRVAVVAAAVLVGMYALRRRA